MHSTLRALSCRASAGTPQNVTTFPMNARSCVMFDTLTTTP